MLKKLILFTILIVLTACDFNAEDIMVNNRRVTYKVNTTMENVVLKVEYYVDNDVLMSAEIDKFPWEIEAYIYPFNKIGMTGQLRYKDETKPLSNYIDLKFLIDVDNEHLNKGDTIYIESKETGFTNEDLKKNTKFELDIPPIENEK